MKQSKEDILSGFAFQDGYKERSKEIYNRYLEIKDDIGARIDSRVEHGYNKNTLRIANNKELLKDYSQIDLLIYADSGNLCFGGRIEGNGYTYYTD